MEKSLTFSELRERHGGHWGEHPDYPVGDWRYEVADGNTRLGYWEWVANQIDSEMTND